jgi:hypothetical protein
LFVWLSSRRNADWQRFSGRGIPGYIDDGAHSPTAEIKAPIIEARYWAATLENGEKPFSYYLEFGNGW